MSVDRMALETGVSPRPEGTSGADKNMDPGRNKRLRCMNGGQPSNCGSRHGSFAMPLGQLLGSVDGQVNCGVGVGVGVGRLVPQGRIPNVGQPTPASVQKFR